MILKSIARVLDLNLEVDYVGPIFSEAHKRNLAFLTTFFHRETPQGGLLTSAKIILG